MSAGTCGAPATFARGASFSSSLGATIVYPFVVERQPWGWHVKLLLYLGIAIALAADNLLMYASVLFINRRLSVYYRAQIAGGVFRQLACWAMHFAGVLNSWTASMAAAIASAIYGLLYRRGRFTVDRLPKKADPATNRRMFHYIAPLMPGMVFLRFRTDLNCTDYIFRQNAEHRGGRRSGPPRADLHASQHLQSGRSGAVHRSHDPPNAATAVPAGRTSRRSWLAYR